MPQPRWGVPVVLLCLLSFTSAMSQQGSIKTEYYRSETSFKQGIELFPFEVHETDYLKVVYNSRGFVETLQWFSRQDVLQKSRVYSYWPDDMSIKRMIEFTPDSLIIRELLFGDEPKSGEVIGYLYGVDKVADFRDRFTEVIYDSSQTIVAYKIMATQGQQIAAVFLDYDSLGFLTNESWFQGEPMKLARSFRYVFHRDSGEQEVIERGRDGQVVSHVRIKLDPGKVPGYGLGDSIENVLNVSGRKPGVDNTRQPDSAISDSLNRNLDMREPLP